MPVDVRLERDLPRLLPAFLPAQRWFGGKARQIQMVDVEDAVWLIEAEPPCALVVTDVRYADGGRERYVLLTAFVTEPARLPVVGRLERSGTALWVVEATTDARAVAALLRGFASRDDIPMLRGGTLRYADVGAEAAHGIARAAGRGSISPLGGEQSNTSLRLDRTLVFKLFRKAVVGESPELEVGRFLTNRTTFRAMPALQGSLTCILANGDSSTVGILQDWIESRSDGWTHVVGESHGRLTATGAGSLPRDLFTLGAMTAGLHAALATDTVDPAFAPEPIAAADVEAWRGSFLERAARTFRLVERLAHGWPDGTRRLGEALLNLRDRPAALSELFNLGSSDGFLKIRIHGDYHLGQVLKTPSGFAVIDFEGEPAAPLADRRRKQCALKDVAGMIRSFDYAVEVANSNATGETMSARHLRDPFLDGYLASAAAGRAAFLPRRGHAIDAWVDFFEVDKALYEVEYEINNRPAWVDIPLRAVLRILQRPAGRGRPPTRRTGHT
jgi:maltose alpha-D-glucosyltransferase/alpha-amylase